MPGQLMFKQSSCSLLDVRILVEGGSRLTCLDYRVRQVSGVGFMKNRNLLWVIFLVAVIGVVYLFYQQPGWLTAGEDDEILEELEENDRLEQDREVPGKLEPEIIDENGQEITIPEGPEREVVLDNLSIPWELVFLPDGEKLVTERAGNLLYVSEDGQVESMQIERVEHAGEGGLLGMALHPDFTENNYLYLYLTARVEGGLINRVERCHFIDGELSKDTVIIDDIPGGTTHDGGRMAFGPDSLLYIATGDAGVPDLSQDRDSLAGKILRLEDDGSIPDDNPFGSEVYSYGHRNPQGLAWDSESNLWATEHGPIAQDELNHIESGKNYGWPAIEGDQSAPGMEDPAMHSGTDETWAPSGAVYYDGSIFFAGLRGATLYEAVLSGTEVVEVKSHLQDEYGRLRNVVLGPEGYFYLLTSNRDGRGSPAPDDDKIIRINPGLFR